MGKIKVFLFAIACLAASMAYSQQKNLISISTSGDELSSKTYALDFSSKKLAFHSFAIGISKNQYEIEQNNYESSSLYTSIQSKWLSPYYYKLNYDFFGNESVYTNQEFAIELGAYFDSIHLYSKYGLRRLDIYLPTNAAAAYGSSSLQEDNNFYDIGLSYVSENNWSIKASYTKYLYNTDMQFFSSNLAALLFYKQPQTLQMASGLITDRKNIGVDYFWQDFIFGLNFTKTLMKVDQSLSRDISIFTEYNITQDQSIALHLGKSSFIDEESENTTEEDTSVGFYSLIFNQYF